MVAKALPIPRGYGRRVAGGAYAECGFGPGGRPVEDFLIDPPLKLVPEAIQSLGLRPIGVTLVERQGVWHIIDWVGSEHYPNVTDYVEEVRRAGVSRRLPRSMDFSKLTPKSRLLLVHSRAWVDNAQAYYEALRAVDPTWPHQANGARPCPRRIEAHNNCDAPPPMCAQLWWQDVTGGIEPPANHRLRGSRVVLRQMPAFDYLALCPPDGVQTTYTPAVFASFPLTRIVVIRDRDGGTHQEALQRAQQAKLPVELEEE